MKTKLLAMLLLAGGSMFAQSRFSVGIGFNQAPQVYGSNSPPSPGPGYNWVDGYWSQDYGQPVWIAGYWNAPVFSTGFGFAQGFDNYFGGGFDRDRNFNGRNRDQARGFNQGQQSYRSNGRNNRGNGNGNGFRGH